MWLDMSILAYKLLSKISPTGFWDVKKWQYFIKTQENSMKDLFGAIFVTARVTKSFLENPLQSL